MPKSLDVFLLQFAVAEISLLDEELDAGFLHLLDDALEGILGVGGSGASSGGGVELGGGDDAVGDLHGGQRLGLAAALQLRLQVEGGARHGGLIVEVALHGEVAAGLVDEEIARDAVVEADHFVGVALRRHEVAEEDAVDVVGAEVRAPSARRTFVVAVIVGGIVEEEDVPAGEAEYVARMLSTPVCGVDIRNDVHAPRETPARRSPTVVGITPHEQSGNGMPSNVALSTLRKPGRAMCFAISV